jgi:hypothetical protein
VQRRPATSGNLFTILSMTLFLGSIAYSVYRGGMRPSTDYYDKGMPDQTDAKLNGPATGP